MRPDAARDCSDILGQGTPMRDVFVQARFHGQDTSCTDRFGPGRILPRRVGAAAVDSSGVSSRTSGWRKVQMGGRDDYESWAFDGRHHLRRRIGPQCLLQAVQDRTVVARRLASRPDRDQTRHVPGPYGRPPGILWDMDGPYRLDDDAIRRACERYGVVRLRMFGSAASDRFDPAASDIDFLVDFLDDAPRGIAPFLELKAELERITDREVDLVEARAIRNPYFARRVFGEAVDVYAA